MAALTQARMGREERMKTESLPLAAGAKAFIGAVACADTTAGAVTPGAAGNANLLPLGEFAASVDNSTGTVSAQVLVSLDREVVARWYDNATGGSKVLAANVFADCYILDDHTVTIDSTGNSVAGRVWAVDSVKGVLVEKYSL